MACRPPAQHRPPGPRARRAARAWEAALLGLLLDAPAAARAEGVAPLDAAATAAIEEHGVRRDYFRLPAGSTLRFAVRAGDRISVEVRALAPQPGPPARLEILGDGVVFLTVDVPVRPDVPTLDGAPTGPAERATVDVPAGGRELGLRAPRGGPGLLVRVERRGQAAPLSPLAARLAAEIEAEVAVMEGRAGAATAAAEAAPGPETAAAERAGLAEAPGAAEAVIAAEAGAAEAPETPAAPETRPAVAPETPAAPETRPTVAAADVETAAGERIVAPTAPPGLLVREPAGEDPPEPELFGESEREPGATPTPARRRGEVGVGLVAGLGAPAWGRGPVPHAGLLLDGPTRRAPLRWIATAGAHRVRVAGRVEVDDPIAGAYAIDVDWTTWALPLLGGVELGGGRPGPTAALLAGAALALPSDPAAHLGGGPAAALAAGWGWRAGPGLLRASVSAVGVRAWTGHRGPDATPVAEDLSTLRLDLAWIVRP